MQTFWEQFDIRRPALARLSAFDTLHPTLMTMLRSVIEQLQAAWDKLKRWLCKSARGLRVVAFIKEYFPSIDLQGEIRAITLLLRYVHIYSSARLYALIKDGQADNRSASTMTPSRIWDAIVHTRLFHHPVGHWLETPLLGLLHYIIDQFHVLSSVDARIHAHAKAFLQAFVVSPTIDAAYDRIRNREWVLRYFVGHEILRKLAKICHLTDLWNNRNVVYEGVRNLLVIPDLLVKAVREEVRAQQRVDALKREAFLASFNIRRGAHDGRFRTNSRGSRRRPASLRRSTSTPRTAADSLSHALVAAQRKLRQTERRTARLVHWYQARAQMFVAMKDAGIAADAAHDARKPSGPFYRRWYQHTRNRFTRAQPTAAQVTAQSALLSAADKTSRRARLRSRSRGHTRVRSSSQFSPASTTSLSARAHNAARSHRICLWDESPLRLLAAFLAPLHIHHRKWGDTVDFVTLTYFFQTHDALPSVASIPIDSDDNRYCRHVRDLPQLGLSGRAAACQERGRRLRGSYCALSYAIYNSAKSIGRQMMQQKKCERCVDVKSSYAKDLDNWRDLQKTCVK